ncbi:hypothetical protein EBU60_06040 [bacterium]|nr:hypothetical protein [bacterium]
MSYTVYELRDSESGSIDNENLESGEVWNVTKKYLIGQCPGGMGEVKDAIADYLPRYWASPVGYWRRKGITIKGVGKGCFECTGEYTTLVPIVSGGGGGDGGQPEDNSQIVPGSIAWDTTGFTEHVTSALGERVVGGDGTEDFGGAINVQGTSVHGVDKVVPAMKYSETWIMPAQVGISAAFVKAVYSLTGTVNASQFRAFSPGEALFMGARAQWSGDQPYTTVTFEWQCRANDDQFYVKSISPTSKEGWEFPWVVYYQSSTGSGFLVQRPACLVIDQIYKKKDWSALGIATAPGARRTGKKATSAATAAAVGAFFG